MMRKIGTRTFVLLIAIVLSIIAINPFLYFTKGVVVGEVVNNSSAAIAGLSSNEIIKEINGIKIDDIKDYEKAVNEIFKGENVRVEIKTNKDIYVFIANTTEFSVKPLPKSRIKLGLDLQGGSRALVKPEEKVDQRTLDNIEQILKNRLNVYGITDVKIFQASDLEGNRYITIEMAGATPKELKDLISSQGKFEGKINNETIFVGGNDIKSICQTPECSGIISCDEYQGMHQCRFQFAVYLSQEAAKKQAEITSKLDVDYKNPQYLNSTLDLYLDDKLVDSLYISKELKGSETTQVAISGYGVGKTRQEAYEDATKNMKKLQTILLTGSLPVKLEIVRLESVSALLGKDVLKSIVIAATIAIVGVFLVIFVRYRNIIFSLLAVLTMLSEILIILGVAALINWNLDLPSIAGIMATIGTGVDNQIVILDEAKTSRHLSLKERLKRAFFIILGSYATIFVAMICLWQAGVGLLKGFALTTLIGATVGILITRPAFGEIINKLRIE
jgi:preprotein translocase subunit SecD